MAISLYISLVEKSLAGVPDSSVSPKPLKTPPFGPREDGAGDVQGAKYVEEDNDESGSLMEHTKDVKKGLYLDLHKAEGQPKPPKAGGESGGGKKGWGQPTDYYSKKMYPERPGNALGETDSSWVLPKGATPVTNNTKSEQPTWSSPEEVRAQKEGSTSAQQGQNASAPSISVEEPVTPAPTPSPAQSPKATSQGLLGGGKATIKDTPKVNGENQPSPAQQPKMGAQDHQDLAAEAQRQGNTSLAAKHGKIAQAKKTLESEGQDDEVDDSAAINSAIQKDKEQSSNKEADKASKEFREGQKSKKKDGAIKDDSAAINAAIQKDNEAKAKIDNKAADKAAKEFKDKQKAKAKDKLKSDGQKKKDDNQKAKDAAKDFKSQQKAKREAAQQAHKDRLAREKSVKQAKKDKEKSDIKEAGKAAKEFKDKQKQKNLAAKKQKEEDKKKLDKQLQSKDDKIAKEAQKKFKQGQEEKARKRRVPSNPAEMADHTKHTSSAKEARSKAKALVDSGAVGDSEKEVLLQMDRAMQQHEKQGHPPDSKEKKELNAIISHVNKLHSANEKEKANKAKMVEAFRKEKQKAVKEQIKAEGRELKEKQKAEQKAKKEQAKEAAREERSSTTTGNRQTATRPTNSRTSPSSSMAAFNQGRGAGSGLDRDATSNSAGGIGSKIIGGAGSGVVSTGHKLLSGDKVKKSLFLDLQKASITSPGQDERDNQPIGLTGESIQEDKPNVGYKWEKEEDDEVSKSLETLKASIRHIAKPKEPIPYTLSPVEKTRYGKSVTSELKARVDSLVKGL